MLMNDYNLFIYIFHVQHAHTFVASTVCYSAAVIDQNMRKKFSHKKLNRVKTK